MEQIGRASTWSVCRAELTVVEGDFKFFVKSMRNKGSIQTWTRKSSFNRSFIDHVCLPDADQDLLTLPISDWSLILEILMMVSG